MSYTDTADWATQCSPATEPPMPGNVIRLQSAALTEETPSMPIEWRVFGDVLLALPTNGSL
jgi:hypothetical protein